MATKRQAARPHEYHCPQVTDIQVTYDDDAIRIAVTVGGDNQLTVILQPGPDQSKLSLFQRLLAETEAAGYRLLEERVAAREAGRRIDVKGSYRTPAPAPEQISPRTVDGLTGDAADTSTAQSTGD